MSPSALDNWINSRSAFIKSYFEGNRSPETGAMKTGTKVHKLIEAGLIKVKCSYDVHEEKLVSYVGKDNQFKFLGIPDDRTRGTTKGMAEFVDYKTGKENRWHKKLSTDVKMKATAWLVWKVTSEPKKVRGHIEYIATEWNAEAREIVPIEDRETELVTIDYHADDLKDFDKVIIKAMNEVNEEYEKWLQSSDELISLLDMETYAELKKKQDDFNLEIDAQLAEISERLITQMETGGVKTIKGTVGTFFITEKKKYVYPPDLKVFFEEEDWLLKDVELMEAAAKVARKNFELITDPTSISKSVGFRAPRET